MSSTKLLLKFARRYPIWISLTIVLGFSGALFNGVSTTLIVPILLNFLGQKVDLKGAPPLIQAIMSPFDGVPEQYRLSVMAVSILLAIVLKNVATYASSLVSSSLGRTLTSDLREEGLRLLLEVDLDYYAKMKVGDLINRLGGEIGRTAGTIGTLIRVIIIA
ncbi:ABC transporter ATP-binding protein, partial [Planktothrix sp. FACHB-1355]|nr:ABC transporter ATP-binding protein [Planktothrix sp. FACHB-1355]